MMQMAQYCSDRLNAALLYGAVRLIKYFIRYGIDYYFQKLKEQQPEQAEHKE